MTATHATGVDNLRPRIDRHAQAKALLAPLRELHAEWSAFLKDPHLSDGASAGIRLCCLELGMRLDAIEAEVSA